jgi:Taurine catabolism dioxygenase TauD, TfdA family
MFSNSSSAFDPSKLFQNFPLQYLREMDSSNFDPHTFQRTDVRFDTGNGKPLNTASKKKQTSTFHNIIQCVSDGSFYHIYWGDGHISKYSMEWLDEILQNWKDATRVTSYERKRILWKDLNEDNIRASNNLCLSFQEAITDDGMEKSLKALYEYGFLLVTNTPIEDGGCGVAALASAFGGGCYKDEPSNLLMHYRDGHQNQILLPHGTDGPLRTMYGTVWSTATSGQAIGTSTADSAYGNDGLPLHTDMTYKYDPPGLQIFTMIQPAIHGGDSVICDGFAVATKLREAYPDAFQLLCETTRRYHCIDQVTGWHMEASGPVIGVDNNTNSKQIVMIRHNDLDRLPDLPSPTTANFPDFYAQLQSAHSIWDQHLSDDSYRLVLRLGPGDTIVVANQVRFWQPKMCYHYLFYMFAYTTLLKKCLALPSWSI